MMTLNQIMPWLTDAVLRGDGATVVSKLNTDTRTIADGDMFVALQGERFDGNQFITQAKNAGAKAILTSQDGDGSQVPIIVVPDTKKALGQIAKGWRQQFKVPLIAVTGSNGKTTVTQMVASILHAYKGDLAFSTIGNLNNDIGVPLTLLRLQAAHQVGVVELGMNHPGEIAYLADIAMPQVALVNNAQREHLEFMTTVDAVAAENGSVIAALPQNGVAVFPADDAYTSVWKTMAADKKTITFALSPNANTNTNTNADVICLKSTWKNGCWDLIAQTPQGHISYTLNVAGEHNVKNSLAAISCALAINVPLQAIAAGLQAFKPVNGRSSTLKVNINNHEIIVIDDTYNANPDSMKAAVDVLSGLEKPRLLVIGDMGEVGQDGKLFHAELGAYADAKNIESVYAFGELAAETVQHVKNGQHFLDVESLIHQVTEQLPTIKSILVKGSRFMKMERVVQAVLKVEQQNQKEREQQNAA